ncbi:hypothetical protein M413DRAFT_420555 [Hebeloma cylindrosporum]|uniref:Uncharacterized protein n=1 Tax=Hebeloma cylindrosporum TaxID=76867 RepID=A0A0C2XL11_HEBCY|nr:hypothetical protein M413DRAFT_420555 [Hebeloma cylindrosporum h7]
MSGNLLTVEDVHTHSGIPTIPIISPQAINRLYCSTRLFGVEWACKNVITSYHPDPLAPVANPVYGSLEPDPLDTNTSDDSVIRLPDVLVLARMEKLWKTEGSKNNRLTQALEVMGIRVMMELLRSTMPHPMRTQITGAVDSPQADT